jgi:peptidoglycan/xylan/chitin deacetylase (PgdA/CDA1 family)
MNVRSLFRKAAPSVSRLISTEKLIFLTGQKVLLPFYHAVSDRELPHLRAVIQVRNISQFLADLDFFLEHFLPAGIRDLMESNQRKTPGSKPVFHLSFDDGLKECITTIAPILSAKGIPATFFVNTEFIGNKEVFYRFRASLIIEKVQFLPEELKKTIHAVLDQQAFPPGHLKERLLSVDYKRRQVLDEIADLAGIDFTDYANREEIYMNEEDIRSLLQQGFTIGSHSLDHPLYKMTDIGEQLRQTFTSSDFLIEKFRVSPVLFSFPFSDDGVSAEFFRKVYKPEGKADLTFGISGLKKEVIPNHLHRIPMEVGPYSARQIITGEYLYFVMKSLIGKNTIRRK